MLKLCLKNHARVLSLLAVLLVLVYFFCIGHYANQHSSVMQWLVSTWTKETDYEHAWLIFPLMAVMLYHKRQRLAQLAAEGQPQLGGLLFMAAGIVLFALAYRTKQPRLAVAAWPFVVSGALWSLWGLRCAMAAGFALFFSYLSIPLPTFQQSTVWLQLLSTRAAELGCKLLGIATSVHGTSIKLAGLDQRMIDIAGGCSGIRSLMALIMISAFWAYVAPLRFWQKVLLFASALPLAIIGNAVRVTSVLAVAKYYDYDFALGTWHDWSGLLVFFPLSLLGLSLLQFGFSNGFKRVFKRRKVVVISARNDGAQTP